MSDRSIGDRRDPSVAVWRWMLALVLILAAGVRAAGLNSSLWYDEIVTLVISVRLPLSQIVTTFPDVNVHPLYSLLSHASIAAGSIADKAVPSISSTASAMYSAFEMTAASGLLISCATPAASVPTDAIRSLTIS